MLRNCIAEKRKAMHLSQAALARALGVHRSIILKWERGDMGISDKSLKNLARFFQVTPAELIPDYAVVPEPEEVPADAD